MKLCASFENQAFWETLNETCVNNLELENMPYWICINLSSKRVYMPFWKYIHFVTKKSIKHTEKRYKNVPTLCFTSHASMKL